jgi:hypothetical protein
VNATVPAGGTPPRLREDLDSLTGLVRLAADHLDLDTAFLEKDFWVTELVRAVAAGDHVSDADGNQLPVTTVFKGGTSLSRVFGLIDRFSEDVDLLVVFPKNAGMGARQSALRRIADTARTHLGLAPEDCTTQESTTGVKRNLRYRYPRKFSNPAAREYLLLEMGSRGGPDPHDTHTMRSMVAEYAASQRGEGPDTWEEFAPLTVAVLAPERTLLEKLALLHNLGSRFPDDDVAQQYMAQAGRHYYDVKCLLDAPAVRKALTDLGTSGVGTLVDDINARSQAAGWRYMPRPAGGFADSPAFDPVAPCRAVAERSFEIALGMVYGVQPTYDDCLTQVQNSRHLL